MRSARILAAPIVASFLVVFYGGTGRSADLPAIDRGATLHLASNTGPNGWDPHRGGAAAATSFMIPVYDRLMNIVGKEMTIAPMLATSWQYSADLKTLTMNLRTDVMFHDGSHFDASVAKANLERAKKYLDITLSPTAIDSIDIVDPATIRLNLSKPDPGLLFKLGSWGGAMVSPKVVDKPDISGEPAGSGPYKPVLSETTSTKFVLERFPEYWDKNVAKAARMEITVIADDQTRVNAFKTKQVDLIVLNALQTDIAKSLTGPGSGAKVDTYLGYAGIGIGVNMTTLPALANPKVRQALDVAIDREAINQQLLGGVCPPSLQIFAPNIPGYVADLDKNMKADPVKAKKLLAEAGVKDLQLSATTPQSEPFNSVAQVIQAEYADIGVTMKVDVHPNAEVVKAFSAGIGNLGPLSLYVGPTSAQAADQYFVRSAGHVPQAFLDLKAKVAVLPQGGAEAKAIYEQMSREAVDDPVVLPVCRMAVLVVSRGNLVGADNLPWLAMTVIYDPTTLAATK